MNIPHIPPQLPELQSENSANDRAPAITAGTDLPPDTVDHVEVSTRLHTVDEADGVVTVDELNQSKRRKMEVEAVSVGGSIQATLDAIEASQCDLLAAMQDTRIAVATLKNTINGRLNSISVWMAKDSNNSKRANVNNDQSLTHPWRRLRVEDVYVPPANNPNPNPPTVFSMPPNQPEDRNAVLAMDDAAIDALGLAFNKTFAGDDLDSRRDAVCAFYRAPHY